ncbi:MAG: hypothetical protein K2W99_06525 [Chthoniobacterales bacterium]|nr:hypothetical protein [Chthoniobacterales bacterium]
MFTFFVTFSCSLLHACEGCKMAVVKGFQEPQTVRAGFALSWSVLFLFFLLFFLFAVLAWATWSACREVEEHRLKAKS